METITFICVNYNNSNYTESFCRSLALQEGLGFEFLIKCMVVDNSTDLIDSDRLRLFCSHYDWIFFIKSPTNLGYFGGLNCGLQYNPQKYSKFIVLCNNDLEFDKKFCQNLLSIKSEPEDFAICPDLITADGIHQNPHIKVPISLFRRLQFDLYFSNYYIARLLTAAKRLLTRKSRHLFDPVKPIEIHMGIGACYILTPSFFIHFHNLNCPVFLYGEEAFFSAQIHSNGGRLIFNPKLKVMHAESATFARVPKRIAYEYAREGYPLYRMLM